MVLCWSVLLAGAGCRGVDPVITLLEQENTKLEDKIFEQQYELRRCQEALESCRRENATIRRKLAAAGDGGEPYGPTLSAPRAEDGDRGEIPGTLELPTVELPTKPMPEGKLPERFRSGGRPEPPDAAPSSPDAGPLDFPPSSKTDQDTPSAPGPLGDNARAASIVLNRFLTGGLNVDRRIGDEGISVLIQPLDEAGEIVLAAAPVSVVVLDPARGGDAARVARWDFTAREVAERVRDRGLGKGIYLEMLWPASAPIHSTLSLYVRYRTDDGRYLEADMEIQVETNELAPRPAVVPPGPEKQSTGHEGKWQKRPPQPSAPAPDEPIQPAVHLTDPERRPSEPERPAPAATQAKPTRPSWSPDRTWPAEM
jgi:hypothetical protein